jgi:V8-like Glu-specific endopeptidase
MSIKLSRITGVAATALILFTPHGQAGAGNTDEGPTQTIVNPHLRDGAKLSTPDKVYTREEILNAKPLKWPKAGNADQRYQDSHGFKEEPPPTTDTMESAPPGLPNSDAQSQAQKDFADQWQLLEEFGTEDPLVEEGASGSGTNAPADFVGGDGINFGTQNIYTSYRGNYWFNQQQASPWRIVGKLLIDGGGYCTAQSITGAPKNIIVTAAHCVYERGVGYKAGWTFIPAERFGAAPYGQFRWASARILNAWITRGGRRDDVALIRLQNNAAGRPVSYYTGWLGWRQNYPYVRSLHSIGYASNIATTWTSICAAESFFASCEGDDVLVKGCNMTYGASGGAFIDDYKPYENGYVDSVVSGPSCAGSFGQTFVGPRFSSANFGALCAAEGGCTTP